VIEEVTPNSLSELTAQNPALLACLFALKRGCQANYLRFDQIENLIYGRDYRFEQRITTVELQ
jgi:hypothetical protein